ncbi:glutamate-rich protein 5 [Elephas maximus indicus]|uniref:glutamate-rich protein 5 n=1 Tax=Elephas maximus indicus TaxID=99487 RepID=UPI002115DE85|nr:glutamate-rich protein 5 [Elephas maximus indicus]
MNDQKVTSNESSPTTEESESCFAQPKPHKMGKESTFYENAQRESLPPLGKLQISARSTANGIKSPSEHPLASTGKDVADRPGSTGKELDQPGSTEKSQLLEGPQDSGPPQLGGKDDTPGTEEKKKDVEAATATQPLKGKTETELLGTEAEGQPLRKVGEKAPPGTVEGTENPQTAEEMKPLGTSEKIHPLETVGELQAQEIAEKDDQPQIPEIVPRENESSEILEGSQLGEIAEEQQLQEKGEKDEQSHLLPTIPKKNETSEISDRSPLVETAVKNDTLHKAPEVLGSMGQIQPEGIAGSLEHPAGIVEPEATVEMVREVDTNEEDQHIEGETGEKVETEMENDKISEGAETKVEETGEAVDPSAAT